MIPESLNGFQTNHSRSDCPDVVHLRRPSNVKSDEQQVGWCESEVNGVENEELKLKHGSLTI